MGNGAARENIRMGSGEVTLLGEARDWGTEARSDEQRKSINANGEMSQGCEGRKWGNWDGWMQNDRGQIAPEPIGCWHLALTVKLLACDTAYPTASGSHRTRCSWRER